MYDLIIRNGLIINSDGVVNADLAVQGEQIVAMGCNWKADAASTPRVAMCCPAPLTRMCICKCRWRAG
ncbi:MAG: hypothetical protein IPM07_23320 [Anaerolineales bacterium]|nr:hypothetical protein [Anaerolineales bacterium]